MKKITDFIIASAGDIAATDLFVVVDDAAGTPVTKSITANSLADVVWGELTSDNVPATDLYMSAHNKYLMRPDGAGSGDVTEGTISPYMQTFLANMSSSGDIVTELSAVPDTREIATTAPLTGGGNLSANRTFVFTPNAADAAVPLAADETVFGDISDSYNPKKCTFDELPSPSGWTLVPTAAYTATPASSTVITMSDTSMMYVGAPLKYSYDGNTYNGMVSAISVDTNITVVGIFLSASSGDDLTSLYVGTPDKVVTKRFYIPGAWDTGAAALILDTSQGGYSYNYGPSMQCVHMACWTRTTDTGGTKPVITPRKGGTSLLYSWGDLVLAADDTWYLTSNNGWTNTGWPGTKHVVIAYGEAIDFYIVTTGTNGDAEDLTIEMTFVRID